MKKIAIVVGHNERSQGAVGNYGLSEFQFNSQLANELVDRLSDSDNEYKIFYRSPNIHSYSQQMIDLHARIDDWGADVSMSMHFNASASPSTGGHEVLYYSNKGGQYAKKLNDLFTKYLPTRDRGIKRTMEHERGGGFLSRGRSYCILAEPFFAAHQDLYVEGGPYRKGLVKAYEEFLRSV